MTVEEVRESLSTAGAGLIEWAAKVQIHDTVQVDWESTPHQVPKAILLTQAINRATEHRAQITGVPMHLGIQPPELDGWTYLREQEK